MTSLLRTASVPASAAAAATVLVMMRRRARIYATLRSLALRLFATVNANPLLQGIAVPSAIGYLIYLSRSLFNAAYVRIAKHFYCTVSISSKDENFTPVVDFVAKLQAEENSLLVAETRKKRKSRKDARAGLQRAEISFAAQPPRPFGSPGTPLGRTPLPNRA